MDGLPAPVLDGLILRRCCEATVLRFAATCRRLHSRCAKEAWMMDRDWNVHYDAKGSYKYLWSEYGCDQLLQKFRSAIRSRARSIRFNAMKYVQYTGRSPYHAYGYDIAENQGYPDVASWMKSTMIDNDGKVGGHVRFHRSTCDEWTRDEPSTPQNVLVYETAETWHRCTDTHLKVETMPHQMHRGMSLILRRYTSC
jgi:hypothetical protein